MSPRPCENMLLANFFASSCPTRWGGRALATERILGTVNALPDVLAGRGQARSRARDSRRCRGRRTGRYACAGGSTSRSSVRRAVGALVAKDLRVELRTFASVPAMTLFAVTTYVLFHFGLD